MALTNATVRENKKPKALINTNTHTHASKPFSFVCCAHWCRGNGACRSDPFWPTGTKYNARNTFARFCTFVLLPSPNNIIFAKRGESTNEYKRSIPEYRRTTKTRGERHPRRYSRAQAHFPASTVNWKQTGQSISNYGRR